MNLSNLKGQNPNLYKADSLFSVGKYAEAISIYEKTEPFTARIYFKTAEAYKAQGNFEKALINYQLGLAKNPDFPKEASEYGKLLYRIGKFKKADSIFQKLTLDFPKNPEFHYHLGLAKEQLKDSTSIVNYQKAFALDNTYQKAIYKLAVHHFQLEEYEKVEFLGIKALESYPENAKIIGLLGQNAMAVRNYSLSVKRFKHLLSLRKNSEFAHENLGLAYFHLGELEKALKHYEQLLQSDPQNIKAYYFSGRIYNLLDETEKAETSLKKALFLKKLGLSGMYQTLGITYKLKKDFAKAIDYFNLALTENPFNMRAQYELAVSADSYYGDLQTRINYYKIFTEKFEGFPGAKPFLDFAKFRITELKKEKFMKNKK